MTDPHNRYEQIEAYLSQRMNAQERSVFEENMKKDAALREEVAGFQLAQEAIRAGGRQSLRQSVDSAYARSQAPPAVGARMPPLRRILSIAAAILLLIAAGFTFYLLGDSSTPESLYADYFELPEVAAVRGPAGNQQQQWNNALTAFDRRDYRQYVTIARPLIDAPGFGYRNEAALYLGLSYLQLDEDTLALEAFESVSRESITGAQADWYSGLAFLKMNNPERARRVFERIVNADPERQGAAEEILEELE